MSGDPKSGNMRRRNLTVMLSLVGLVFGMIGLSFASVPLYNLFCKATGFGGTTQVAEGPAGRILDRKVKIRFNADVNGALPWGFRPETHEMEVRIGEAAMTSYRATNHSDQPIVGMAAYNVTPDKAGLYFNKTQCFCFNEQRLEPGQTVDMPVYFFVDPAMADDPKLDDVSTITLSYTFFRAHDDPGLVSKAGAASNTANSNAVN